MDIADWRCPCKKQHAQSDQEMKSGPYQFETPNVVCGRCNEAYQSEIVISQILGSRY